MAISSKCTVCYSRSRKLFKLCAPGRSPQLILVAPLVALPEMPLKEKAQQLQQVRLILCLVSTPTQQQLTC